MKTNLNLASIQKKVTALTPQAKRHSTFIALMVVLLAYIVVVWRISQLAVAEPSADATAASQTSIPHVDQKAIDQIQSLEQNNTQVQSLFDSARNNPFQE
jgi:predicted negative regulator of RcsB-dependent stress response